MPSHRYTPALLFLYSVSLLVGAAGDEPLAVTQNADRAEMILIPPSKFVMGTDPANLPNVVSALSPYSAGPRPQIGWFLDEVPPHPVELDAYTIDKYEVTNAQYRRFLEATGHREPVFWNDSRFNQPSQPVVGVSWDDAMAYAKWAGKTLPTEAQWENAARGGAIGKRFAWGDEWPPPPNAGNFANRPTDKYADGFVFPAPVGGFRPNGYGVHDLEGNVAEWCLDAYSETFYRTSPLRNPVYDAGESVRALRVVRGGGWTGSAIQLRCAYRGRDLPTARYELLGFRCVGVTELRHDGVMGLRSSNVEERPRSRTPSPQNAIVPSPHHSALSRLPFADAGKIAFRHVAGISEKRHLFETMGSGAAFLDYDNDGDLDLYCVNGGFLPVRSVVLSENAENRPAEKNRLYRNDGDGAFTDVTESAGVGDTGYGMGVAVGDFDNDGDEDIYVANLGRNVLYRNNGNGTFTDVTESAGVGDPSWSIAATFTDVDGDSHLDLFVVNYVEYDLSMKPCLNNDLGILEYCHPRYFEGKADVLYHNNGDGTFREITPEAGVKDGVDGKGMGVAVGDYDNDGKPDIYVPNDTARNFLYRNRGGSFEETGFTSGTAYDANGLSQGSMGVDFGDYDNDGDLDLLVFNSSYEMNLLYRNDGNGLFTDVSIASGLGPPSLPMVAFGGGFLDYDNDGDLDVFVSNGHLQPDVERLSGGKETYAQRGQLFSNNGDRTFTEVYAGGALAEKRVGRGVAFGDYDNDGDTDIFLMTSNEPSTLLRNEVGQNRHWLRMEFVGTRSNRDGLGTRVEIESGGRRQMRETHSGSSYASESDRRVLFGLGDTTLVERVTIRWQSGKIQRLENIPANQTLRILEPD